MRNFTNQRWRVPTNASKGVTRGTGVERMSDWFDRLLAGATGTTPECIEALQTRDALETVFGDPNKYWTADPTPTAPLVFDYTKPAPGFDPDAMLELEDLDTDMAAKASRSMKEQLEYELRGAWRAGYNYLHVYRDLPSRDDVGRMSWTITQRVFPAYSEKPPEPDGVEYAYTYDVTDVPDHVMRAASRGELDEYERIER